MQADSVASGHGNASIARLKLWTEVSFKLAGELLIRSSHVTYS